MTAGLADFVDLERYPIDRPDGAAGQALIERCRDDLDRVALCTLPGFLTGPGLASLQAAVRAEVPRAHPIAHSRTPYGWMDNRGFPPDHPRSVLFPVSSGVITTELFPPDNATRDLFNCDALTEFVRRVLGFGILYRSACPHLSIQVNVLGEGDSFGWHFDTNDGVVSLILQEADSGGQYEYVPYIRDEDDENYDAVGRLFDGRDEPLRPALAAGTFTLFKGRRSIHRVSEVGPTRQPRLSLLYSYDHQPGMVFPERTVQKLINPGPEPHFGVQG